jgi:hypothetical protein
MKVQWTFFLLDSTFLEAFAVVFTLTTETNCRDKGIGYILRVFYFIVVHWEAMDGWML